MPKVTIIVCTYNRPKSLKRLLDSLSSAFYPKDQKVDLIISIDKSDCKETPKIADDQTWDHGEKIVLKHPKNLGLRKHILLCGDLTQKHENVILLEDDLFVSPYYFEYTLASLEKFSHNPKIAGISLFNHIYNETPVLGFEPRHDGYDNYFLQLPCSWGQVWTKKQWSEFKDWYENNSHKKVDLEDKVPLDVTKWPDSSWKKYYIKYMVEKDLFFSYPSLSLSTNFMEEGVHHKRKQFHLQATLLNHKKDFKFSDLDESKAKYDVFCEILPEILKEEIPELREYSFISDLYGMKSLKVFKEDYWLTCKKPLKNPIKSWDRALRPHEQNILLNLHGDSLILAKRDDISPARVVNNIESIGYYYGIPLHFLEKPRQVIVQEKFSFKKFVKKVLRKIKSLLS